MLRLARSLARLASLFVPRDRAGFVREWDAELWHEAREVGPDLAGRWTLVRHALGAWSDVRAQRSVERDRRGGGTMAGWWEGWGKELRLAGRSLGRSPGFTAVAVLTLALGIGGSASIYTLLDRIVLDPLPYPDQDRLVELANAVPGVGEGTLWGMSTAQYVFLNERPNPLESHAIYRSFGANLVTPAGPQRAFGWRISADLLPMLGARPTLGRLIDATDDSPTGAAVAVLSYDFWERQYGSDEAAVGQALLLDGNPYEIIGVLERGVQIPGASPASAPDVWIPMQIDPAGYFGNNHVFSMIGRLRPDTDVATAEAMLLQFRDALPERFPDAYSQSFFDGSGFRTRVTPLKQAVVGDLSTNLWVLFGGVGLVLLIACANVSNLFLVRIDGRRQELAVRAALGAGRAELARYLLAEGLALSCTGGVLAVLVSWWGVPTLAALAPDALPRLDSFVGIGGETVAFALLLSAIVGAALIVVPLLRHSRIFVTPSPVVARSVGASPGRQRARSALVMTQVALALTLVSAAGLMIESVRRLAAIDPGMDPEGVVTASIYLTPSRFGTSTEKWTAYREILTRVESVPGVVSTGMSTELPADGGFGCTVQGFEEQAVYDRLSEVGVSTCAGQEPTTPGYFETARIPVLQGRSFEMGDNDNPGTGAVVVSLAFADRFWPGEDPIGKGVAPNGRREGPFYRVVGVVGDVPSRSLDGQTAMAIYYPMVSHPGTPATRDPLSSDWMHLVVRTESDDPLSLFPAIRRAVQSVDPTIPVDGAQSMEGLLAESVARFTFTSILLTIAAFVALGLAAVGLFGVVSYVVGQSRREIGMRIAIGANPTQVQRLFVLRSAPPILLGLTLGVVLALVSGRALEGLLYGVSPTDPTTLVAAGMVLGGVASLASWIPARRASRVDPSLALRID